MKFGTHTDRLINPLYSAESSKVSSPLVVRMFVMVAGNSRLAGLCVVIPTSIDPDHLSTRWSNRICGERIPDAMHCIFRVE
jgi:hypothetical protein